MSTLVLNPEAVSAPADAPARAAALDPHGSFLVEAPAGSGKTGLLVQRFLRVLSLVERPESVLALTFTNKATAEMRERVLHALDLPAQDPGTLGDFERTTRDLATTLLQHDRNCGWNLQENSHRLNIRTLDSLCGEIARALPLSSGAAGQMPPVTNAMPLYRQAARSVVLRLGGDDPVVNHALQTALLHRDADLNNCEALLAQMLATREQWARLIPLTPELLTNESLEREVKPKLDRVLDTVVCRTLSELEAAFPAPELHTLTQLAVRLAHAEPHGDGTNPLAACAGFTSVPGSQAVDAEHWRLLAHLLLTSSDGWRKKGGLTPKNLQLQIDPEKQALTELLETLSTDDTLYRKLCDLRNLPPSSVSPEDWRVIKALFQLLRVALLDLHKIFRNSNTSDFTERSLAARAALGDGVPGQPSASTYRSDIEHLLVDEMQDTSSAQYELLEALTRGWDGVQRTVFLVGDPKQSIYLFRQARVERFLSSMQTGALGSVQLTTLRLTTNFRSAAPLVEEFHRLFAPVFAAGESGGIPYTAATASRTGHTGRLTWTVNPLWGEHGSPVRRASRLLVQREQAADIVRSIYQLRADSGSATPPTIAVLVRGREHAVSITRLLREAAIPFRGVELERLDERPEVLDTLALTRALLHPADRVAWLSILRAPWCGATLADLHHLAAADEPGSRTRPPRTLFRDRAATLPAEARSRVLRTLDVLDSATEAFGRTPTAELVERTGRALGAGLFRTATERNNVHRFLELLEQAEAELRPLEARDLQNRLTHLYAEPDTAPGAVDIMTVHKAKGLEWDVVFVPELQRAAAQNRAPLLDWLELPTTPGQTAGVLLAPIQPSGDKAAGLSAYVRAARRRQESAELARLLYVVTTRARRELHLYAAPELKKQGGEVIHVAGTLLHTAWPAAGDLIQQKASARQKTPGELELLQAGAYEFQATRYDLSDRRRVPVDFDPAALQQPLVLPWLQALSGDGGGHALERVDRPEGSLHSRALGTTVHLFLERLARQLAAGTSPPSLLAAVKTWTERIRATLRSMGSTGNTLERDTAAVLLALRNTIDSPEGRWLLQPHAQARSEGALLATANPASDAPAQVLRLDRSFLAGSEVGSIGTGTLWIVDYKTATPGGLPMDEFLRGEREHYAPQLRNYARILAGKPGTPPSIMLALFYPMLPTLDAWPYTHNPQ